MKRKLAERVGVIQTIRRRLPSVRRSLLNGSILGTWPARSFGAGVLSVAPSFGQCDANDTRDDTRAESRLGYCVRLLSTILLMSLFGSPVENPSVAIGAEAPGFTSTDDRGTNYWAGEVTNPKS